MSEVWHNEDVIAIVQEVFSSTLGEEVSPADSTVLPDVSAGKKISASIGISGDWNGTLTLECNSETACLLAGAMLATDPFPAVDDDVRDVMGEIANIVAGNVKSILPGSSTLSLPLVVEGDFSLDIVNGEKIFTQLLSYQGSGLLVSIVQAKLVEESKTPRLAQRHDRLPTAARAADNGRA